MASLGVGCVVDVVEFEGTVELVELDVLEELVELVVPLGTVVLVELVDVDVDVDVELEDVVELFGIVVDVDVEVVLDVVVVVGGGDATFTATVYERAEPETGSAICTVTKFLPVAKLVSP